MQQDHRLAAAGMLPGVAKMKSQLENANLDDRVIKRQRAVASPASVPRMRPAASPPSASLPV